MESREREQRLAAAAYTGDPVYVESLVTAAGGNRRVKGGVVMLTAGCPGRADPADSYQCVSGHPAFLENSLLACFRAVSHRCYDPPPQKFPRILVVLLVRSIDVRIVHHRLHVGQGAVLWVERGQDLLVADLLGGGSHAGQVREVDRGVQLVHEIAGSKPVPRRRTLLPAPGIAYHFPLRNRADAGKGTATVTGF